MMGEISASIRDVMPPSLRKAAPAPAKVSISQIKKWASRAHFRHSPDRYSISP
jgi:hypothetical protein